MADRLYIKYAYRYICTVIREIFAVRNFRGSSTRPIIAAGYFRGSTGPAYTFNMGKLG